MMMMMMMMMMIAASLNLIDCLSKADKQITYWPPHNAPTASQLRLENVAVFISTDFILSSGKRHIHSVHLVPSS
jgi:hypothetical protein